MITLIQSRMLCTTPGMSEWHFAAATGICSLIYFEKRDEMQQCSSKSTQIHSFVRGRKVYPPSPPPPVSKCETRKSWTSFILLLLLLSLNKGQSIANAKTSAECKNAPSARVGRGSVFGILRRQQHSRCIEFRGRRRRDRMVLRDTAAPF